MNYTKPAVLPAWGETNQTTADMVQPSNGDIQTGWPQTSTPPSRQRWNWMLFFLFNAVRYFMQRGVVDYDAAETYQIGARVIGDDGNTYKSLTADNINHAPSASPTQWALWGLTLTQINASQLTQATAAAGDNSTKVASTAFVTSAVSTAVGPLAAKTLQASFTDYSATGARSLGTLFQNTTGSPILLTVTCSAPSGTSGTAAFYLGASNTPAQIARQSTPATGQSTISYVVPANWYYKATADTLSLSGWTETMLFFA